MKIKVWVVATCVPGENTPSFPSVYATSEEAEAAMDINMRGEWDANGPLDDETMEKLPYPGDWRDAQAAIHEDINLGASGEEWGRWEITAHEIEVPVSDAAEGDANG